MSKKEKEAKEEKEPQEKAEKTAKASEKKDEKKKSETDMLKEQLEEANDKFLRLNAEYQNFKRRSEKEKQETYSFAKVDIIKELLPVIDNLERAIASDGNNDYDGLKKGVEMTFDSLMRFTAKAEKPLIRIFTMRLCILRTINIKTAKSWMFIKKAIKRVKKLFAPPWFARQTKLKTI